MFSTFHVSLRSLRLILPVLALVTGFACGGLAWLLMVPAMFALGSAYGSRSESRNRAGQRDYGVGAALAGFMPVHRK